MKKQLLIVFLILISGCSNATDPLPPIEKLDAYLQSSESEFGDITKGAEKLIVWANGKPEKTEFSVVYLHGYSATRQESAPVADYLAEALGANAFHTRLTGHGRPDEKLAESSVKAWKQDTWEAFNIGKSIGSKVIVVSASTGGTLSTWLTSQPGTESILAQILISPNFDIPRQSAYQLDLPLGVGVKYVEWKFGKNYSWEPRNELQEKYWNTTYPIKAVRPMIQLLKEVKKIDKAKINTPTLMIYSPEDTVILPSAIIENFEMFGSTKKALVEYIDSEDTSHHILAGYILSPSSIQPVLNIINEFLIKNQLATPAFREEALEQSSDEINTELPLDPAPATAN